MPPKTVMVKLQKIWPGKVFNIITNLMNHHHFVREKGHTAALRILKDEAKKRREKCVMEKRAEEIELEAKRRAKALKKEEKQVHNDDESVSCCCCFSLFFAPKPEPENIQLQDGGRAARQKLEDILVEEIIKPHRPGNDCQNKRKIKQFLHAFATLNTYHSKYLVSKL